MAKENSKQEDQIIARVPKDLKLIARHVCSIEGITLNALVNEGLTLAIGIHVQRPEFADRSQALRSTLLEVFPDLSEQVGGV